MNRNLCPKDRYGKHNYHPQVPFGDPNGKPVGVHCRNCGKTIDYTENENEVAFPDLDKEASTEE